MHPALTGPPVAQSGGMRLAIHEATFSIEDVPADLDLSGIPRSEWSKRGRTLRARSRFARQIEAELARHGVRLTDADVRAAAAEAVATDPLDGASGVGMFGDPRALPELVRAFDAFGHLDCAVCDYYALISLTRAIRALGGTLSSAQAAKFAAYRERQKGVWTDGTDFDGTTATERLENAILVNGNFVFVPPRSPTVRLGRNDACHCGSGLKYKRCHLDADARQRSDSTVLPH
jgi:hypothetical protein